MSAICRATCSCESRPFCLNQRGSHRIVPINPKSGERELEHILSDSKPDITLEVDLSESGSLPADEPGDEASTDGESASEDGKD